MSKNKSLKKRIYKKILEMDDITYEINRKLKYIHDSDMSYKKKQYELKRFLKEIYKKYDVEDVVERKLYLQSKLDSQNSIFGTIALAIIVWLALEAVKLVVTYFLTDSGSVADLLPVVIAPFFAMLIGYAVSHWLGRHDTKYRKYNLIDFELDIINEVLEKNFHYRKTIQNIINTRFIKIIPSYKRYKRVKYYIKRDHCCSCKRGRKR